MKHMKTSFCISINHRFKRTVKHAKTYPGTDCGSDYVPVIMYSPMQTEEAEESKKITKKLGFEQLTKPERAY